MKWNMTIQLALVFILLVPLGIYGQYIVTQRENSQYIIIYEWRGYYTKEYKEVDGRIEFYYNGRLVSVPKEGTTIQNPRD